MSSKAMTLYIKTELKDKLVLEAKEMSVSQASIVSIALSQYFKRQEVEK